MAMAGTVAASSLAMVPSPDPSAMVALTGAVRPTVNVSVGSIDVSPSTVTDTVRVVAPGVKVRVPDVAV